MLKKWSWLMVLGVVSLAGCSGLNISGAGEVAGINLGASVDPINRTVNATSSQTVKKGGVATTINTSSDGKSVGVDADLEKAENDGEE